jgi:hypothetical protein
MGWMVGYAGEIGGEPSLTVDIMHFAVIIEAVHGGGAERPGPGQRLDELLPWNWKR